MKKILTYNQKSTNEFRNETRNLLLNKYFALFMDRYKFKGTEELTDEMSYYALKRFWKDGKIACAQAFSGVSEQDGNISKYPYGMIYFCPFAPTRFNNYDYPVACNLINIRGVTYIPTSEQIIDKDVVIGWANKNHKPIGAVVEWYVDKLTDIEVVIRNNLIAHKFSWIIKTTPENEVKIRKLADNMMSDEPLLYVGLSEYESGENVAEPLANDKTYIIDKLYIYKQKLENELLTFLGVNNTGDTEKKEHLIGDEVNANNEVIETYGDTTFDCLKEFCERVQAIFGYPLDVEVKEIQYQEYATEDGSQEGEKQNDPIE